jgi:hypothetical protein
MKKLRPNLANVLLLTVLMVIPTVGLVAAAWRASGIIAGGLFVIAFVMVGGLAMFLARGLGVRYDRQAIYTRGGNGWTPHPWNSITAVSGSPGFFSLHDVSGRIPLNLFLLDWGALRNVLREHLPPHLADRLTDPGSRSE